MMHHADRLQLFPETARIEDNSIKIDGQSLTALAEKYGTPLYVYERITMDAVVLRYKEALKAHYPGAAFITYAGKAFLCGAIAAWAVQQQLWVDCTGEGEIGIASAAAVPPANMVAHGVNKSAADLQAAIRHAGTIVVDNLSELHQLARIHAANSSTRTEQPTPDIWLRLQPEIAVATQHAHTQTGQRDSKFGMTPDEVLEAAKLARAAGLQLNGLHFHLGSNFRETTALISAIEMAIGLAAELDLGETWHFSPGGGWAVPSHEDELPPPEINVYVRAISQEIAKRCRLNGLRLPALHLEPGRSLIARAGVAIYRVGAVKRRKARTWLLVDGGMADNPRHALYGSRYTCLPVTGLGRAWSEVVSIGGPYCESGDVLIEQLPMPRIEEGELLAVPVSGAYQLSMSSNYNGAHRPAVIWLEKGRARLILRRETTAELLQRDTSFS